MTAPSSHVQHGPQDNLPAITLQRHFKSIRFENKDLWAWKRLLSIVAYDRKIVI